MLTYLERYRLINDDTFSQRVKLALSVTSIGVVDENPNTPNHAARLVKANQFLTNSFPVDEMRSINLRLMANQTVGAQGMDVTDAALQSAVDNIFNDLI